MSPLPQDEFALEMRSHFLDSMTQSLQELNSEAAFSSRFRELSQEWEAEAKANELPVLASLLQSLRLDQESNSMKFAASVLCRKLSSYVLELKLEGDSAELQARFFQVPNVNAEDSTKTFLQCRRGEMRFLLAVENVVEISRYRKINPLPVPEERVKGLIGFRGIGTPVFNLEYAGYPKTEEKSFFVICEYENSFFALEVNATDDVLKLKPSEFQPSAAGASSQFTTKDDKILLLLDIKKLVA